MTTRSRLAVFMNTTRTARVAGLPLAMAAFLVAAAGCGGGDEPATTAPGRGSSAAVGATEPLQLEQGHLAWGELRLGMTVREAREKLGRDFGFTGTEGACPGVTAPVRLHGHAVHVTFDSKKPEGKLRGATVELTDGDLESLVAAVRGRIPGLEAVPSEGAADSEEPGEGMALLALTADPEQAVMAKPAEALTITYTECLN